MDWADPSSFFDRVVVVNLKRRPDRWGSFCAHLTEREWPFSAPQRFEAIDGRIHDPPPWWQAGRPAWGCHQSIVAVLHDAIRDGVERLLVLEDDVCFRAPLAQLVTAFVRAVPSEWDQLYLGGQHLGHRQTRPIAISPLVIRGFNINRSHAFVVRKRFLLPLHRHLTDYAAHARRPKRHVDHRMGVLHGDERYGIYAPRRWIAGQCAGHSDLREARLGERFWDLHIEVPKSIGG